MTKNLFIKKNKKLLIPDIDPNSSSLHFYGWDYIKNNINNSLQNFSNNLVDYVDTFFNTINAKIEIPWYGIIHHTSSTFSNNNVINLFQHPGFLHSLKYCRGLITLSEYNKKNILIELNKISISIPIHVLSHPMPPIYNIHFSIHKFEASLAVYAIGGWLRNPYTIYHAKITYNGQLVNKCRLKHKFMEPYFPTKNVDFMDIIQKYIINKEEIQSEYNAIYSSLYSRPNTNLSYYIKYLLKYVGQLIHEHKILDFNKIYEVLIRNHNSVKEVNTLTNNQYINMLVSSVVFIDYIDCSASNTIVECISTCTPIVLNKHPAVVEYLGNNYPLYSENIYNPLLGTYELTTNNIANTYSYLYRLKHNTNLLNIDIFINSLKNIVISPGKIKYQTV